jgi:three-Cys-motif partner protein
MKVLESYRGREQTYIKHTLLEAYLLRLFMIIGLRQKKVRYVDCFSGPWQEGSADLRETSIGISLKNIQKCREGLKKNGKDVTFHALFIEKDPNSFQKLRNYLSSVPQQEVSTDAFHGDFFNLRGSILEWCGPDDFTFFFIDPSGWKNAVEESTLAPLLQRPNSEFLINFMYDFLLRTHTQEPFREHMHAVFGESPNTEGKSPEEREEYLLSLYRNRLKDISPAGTGKLRIVSVPVLYPTKDRTYYHLVYLTRHPKGITEFMEVSEHLDFVQRRARAQAKQAHRESRTRQIEIFQSYNDVQPKENIDLKEIKNYWLQRLSYQSQQFGIEQLADMLEETGWFESDFQAAFGELAKEGKVENLDDKAKRRSTRYVHFDAHRNRGECLTRTAL